MKENKKILTKKIKILLAVIISAVVAIAATQITVSEIKIRQSWWYGSDSHDAVVTFIVPAFEYRTETKTVSGEKQTISVKFSDQGIVLGTPMIDWCPKEVINDIIVEIKFRNRTVFKGKPENANDANSKGYVRVSKKEYDGDSALLYYRFYCDKGFENWQYMVEEKILINNCTDGRKFIC